MVIVYQGLPEDVYNVWADQLPHVLDVLAADGIYNTATLLARGVDGVVPHNFPADLYKAVFSVETTHIFNRVFEGPADGPEPPSLDVLSHVPLHGFLLVAHNLMEQDDRIAFSGKGNSCPCGWGYSRRKA